MRILVISLINILIGQLFVEFSLELPICEYETMYFYFNFSFVGLLSCFYMTYFICSIFFNFE